MTWEGIVNLRLLIVDCGLGTWIPAFAGMTWEGAGMTGAGGRNDVGVCENDVGVCGNDGGGHLTTASDSSRLVGT